MAEGKNRVWPVLEAISLIWRDFITRLERRQSSRNYTVPDPPGLFDGHVWPMYVKHKMVMEDLNVGVENLDGTKTREELFNRVYGDVLNMVNCKS